MELTELKNMWQQYDNKLSENLRINKEILRQTLTQAPQRRLNREKLYAAFNLIMPIIIISLILIPNITPRNTIDFYLGLGAFGIPFILTYVWSAQYFLLINKIDFSNQVTTIKKQIKLLEKHKTKITKLGFLLMPLAITGIFLLGNIDLFSRNALIPLGLILLVMIISGIYSFKIALYERFKKLNREIREIEKLKTD